MDSIIAQIASILRAQAAQAGLKSITEIPADGVGVIITGTAAWVALLVVRVIYNAMGRLSRPRRRRRKREEDDIPPPVTEFRRDEPARPAAASAPKGDPVE